MESQARFDVSKFTPAQKGKFALRANQDAESAVLELRQQEAEIKAILQQFEFVNEALRWASRWEGLEDIGLVSDPVRAEIAEIIPFCVQLKKLQVEIIENKKAAYEKSIYIQVIDYLKRAFTPKERQEFNRDFGKESYDNKLLALFEKRFLSPFAQFIARIFPKEAKTPRNAIPLKLSPQIQPNAPALAA